MGQADSAKITKNKMIFDSLKRFVTRLNGMGRFAYFSLFVLLILTFFGGRLAPYNPEKGTAEILLPPSSEHLFGTDKNGMDIFSRVITAPKTDVTIAFVATLISFVIGVPIGVCVGYFEGRTRVSSILGESVMRLLDVVQAFPVFVFALVLVAVRGTGEINIVTAIAFVTIPVFVRLARSQILSLRSMLYTEAARAIGNSGIRIAFYHLLPNALIPLIAQLSITMGFGIMLTAGLCFVGAGVTPPTPELGAMISLGSTAMINGQWWPSLFPGIALGLTVFTFAVVGESLGSLLTNTDQRENEDGADLPVGDDKADDVIHNDTIWSLPDGARALLQVDGFCVSMKSGKKEREILRDISFNVSVGEIIGIVGESGAGKSVLVQALLRLLPENGRITAGSVRYLEQNLISASDKEMMRLRGKEISQILPNARVQLNPLVTVGEMMSEAIKVHNKSSEKEIRSYAAELLTKVGIQNPKARLSAYPYELSGGMAQRVCIALALAHNPRLLVADEPTAGLDVTVQRQVLDLMVTLAREHGSALIFVTRDLGIVAQYCDKVAVMQGGRIVESEYTENFFNNPRHAYSKELIRASQISRFLSERGDAE